MKKTFLIIGLILSIGLLTGCPGPNDPVVYLSFEEAVQEVYEMAGRTLFYSTNGITMDKYSNNRFVGPNEIPGVCTDYAIEFAYYWNEVKNYDELYGKAYIAWYEASASKFYIVNFNFAKNGTSKIRENSGKFTVNANLHEADGVYRDVIVTSFLYGGRNVLHFGSYIQSHMYPVINIGDDWYDTEPTWRDYGDTIDYVPYKIIF